MTARRIALPTLLLLSALTILPGCGKPRNVVQLLPDPDGHVGQVTVTTQGGSAQLTQAGYAVRVANAKSMPTQPEALTEAESEALFGAARRALPEKPVRFILNFESETTRLTPESQALLPKVLSTARERSSRDIAIVGHASAAGDENYNIDISRRRAEIVRKLLLKAGMPPEAFEVASHGSANPLVISGNPHEPKNRRVEVTVR
ncbi:MAG: OmpA family protein [Humidesulfovibrio sp.]|jgi:outer membrane protein OmpA-like peptidoglycan-associated protein|uniref:OmpA family protein n=1 Tax=Humidesulfovibrio sp. TaxID=2910988 RepID=UPI0027370C70|nr:OmpA family protein [Humidesulfovibrio sp.]MDP2847384.1 OmpA family protein [Humidesulfovibrio sp.]